MTTAKKTLDLDRWQERALTAQQVATLLNIHVSSVYRKAQNGELPPPRKVAGLTRWLGAEIAPLFNSTSQQQDESPT